MKAPALPFRCTVQAARETRNNYPTKISDVCRALGVVLNHHEALSNAMACARIMIAAHAIRSLEQTPTKLYHNCRLRCNLCVRRIVGAGFDTTPKNYLLTRAPSYVLDMFIRSRRRTALSAPLEPAPTLRGGGPFARVSK